MTVVGARRKVTRLASLMAGLTLGLSAIPVGSVAAQAAPGCVLQIKRIVIVHNVRYQAHVDCGLFTPGPWTLYGDDGPVREQFLISSNQPAITVPRNLLDEDRGITGRERDEIFARVSYQTSSGAVTFKDTNVVWGFF